MYSPKINERLIPALYRSAKAQSLPMTKLVDRLLLQALSVEPLPAEAYAMFLPYQMASGISFEPLINSSGESIENLRTRVGASAFRHGKELDAWCQSTAYGLCRASELAAAGSAATMQPHRELLRALREVHEDSHANLSREP